MHRVLSSIMIFVIGISVFPFQDIFAQENELDNRLDIDVPYSLVQNWAMGSKLTFPKKTSSFSRQNNLTLQYYLQSRTYKVPPTGIFDNKTRESLSAHQNGVSDELLPGTVKNINEFYSYLYCPTGLTLQDNQDFRLENVNKKRILPSNYIPNNLVIDSSKEFPATTPVCLEREAYDALKKMYEAAKSDGVSLFITSSYRGEDSQDYLLHVMIKRMGNAAYRIVAKPGLSEHNLGMAVDFTAMEGTKRIPLTGSRQIKWLEDNAAEFGFVNSYPVGKEAITGFRPEPWHWRHIGTPSSTVIEQEHITLAEFLDKYRDSIQRYKQSLLNSNTTGLLEDIVIGG